MRLSSSRYVWSYVYPAKRFMLSYKSLLVVFTISLVGTVAILITNIAHGIM